MPNDTHIDSLASRVWRLAARALPTQFARRRRRLRWGGGGRSFLGIVTGCVRDGAGNLTITGKKLTAKPYAFDTGEEFEAFAGINPIIVHDTMVLVVSIEPLADDRTITNYAVPHLESDPAHLDEPDENCIVSFGPTCDTWPPVDPCA